MRLGGLQRDATSDIAERSGLTPAKPISLNCLYQQSHFCYIAKMAWSVETLDQRVDDELLALPADMQARFFKIAELIEAKGLSGVREPHGPNT